jgi:hypothetical protein
MLAVTEGKRTVGRSARSGIAELLLAMAVCTCAGQQANQANPANSGAKPLYPGFDRNDYPGDGSLAALRKNFRYTSFWLNPPPGEKTNSWAGKRATLRQYGFGFLVLFNGRTDRELKSAALKGQSAGELGAADGSAVLVAAAREGFARNVLIFLDQEEGGRLLPEQAAYLFAWIDAVRKAGTRAGVYCSGIEVTDSSGTISTAEDIVAREAAVAAASGGAKDENGEKRLALWIANDQCPPAPGCTLDAPPLDAVLKPSITDFAAVWQYAQSPRRPQFSANCPAKPADDGNCYAPGLPPGASTFLDLDTSESPDPSELPDRGSSFGGEKGRFR